MQLAREDLYDILKYVVKSRSDKAVGLEVEAYFKSGLFEAKYGCDPQRVKFWFNNFYRVWDFCNWDQLRERVENISQMYIDVEPYMR